MATKVASIEAVAVNSDQSLFRLWHRAGASHPWRIVAAGDDERELVMRKLAGMTVVLSLGVQPDWASPTVMTKPLPKPMMVATPMTIAAICDRIENLGEEARDLAAEGPLPADVLAALAADLKGIVERLAEAVPVIPRKRFSRKLHHRGC